MHRRRVDHQSLWPIWLLPKCDWGRSLATLKYGADKFVTQGRVLVMLSHHNPAVREGSGNRYLATGRRRKRSAAVVRLRGSVEPPCRLPHAVSPKQAAVSCWCSDSAANRASQSNSKYVTLPVVAHGPARRLDQSRLTASDCICKGPGSRRKEGTMSRGRHEAISRRVAPAWPPER